MTTELKVLGIDLASSSWRDNGSALVTFTTETPAWVSVRTACINWPKEELSASSMVGVIDQFVVENEIHAVSLDGPQGWREPNALPRKGVGRWYEYQVLAQGKAGLKGITYPKTQRKWFAFCIDIFANLIKKGHARLANDSSRRSLDPLPTGSYWLLESFPTSVWRTSKLRPLPGKARMRGVSLSPWVKALRSRYGLPELMNSGGSHDDLQALVACMPGAALLGGPARSVHRGNPAYHVIETDHWVEGIIWDCEPSPELAGNPIAFVDPVANSELEPTEGDASNPLIVDERDDEGGLLIERGVELFKHLVKLANDGESVGVGYAQFACCVHGVESFCDIADRPYAQCDTANVLRLAHQVTAAAPPMRVTKRDSLHLDVGMDAFIWRKKPPYPRPLNAFKTEKDRASWLAAFPDGTRRLLNCGGKSTTRKSD
jgi:hypothetical protein